MAMRFSLLIVCLIYQAECFLISTPARCVKREKCSMSLDYIKCVGNKIDQRLPLSLVSSFGRWILVDGKLLPILNSDRDDIEREGWCDPVSFEEVWLPVDLPAPTQRPAIAALVKDGAIRYIMPALDISVEARPPCPTLARSPGLGSGI